MPVAASDIRYYGCANHQETDSGTQGGAINTSVKVEFDDITPTGVIEMVSSNAGDTTQTVQITGRTAAGVLTQETKTLNGTTAVDFATSWERIIKVVKSGTTAGTITLRKDGAAGDLVIMDKTPHEILTVRRPFYDVSADASGGSTRNFYEKIFAKNGHATLALTNAVVTEQSDPSGKITFGLPATLDDSGTSTNRITAPASITFDSAAKNVANSQNLTAGAAQGIWLNLTLNAGDAATKTTYTSRVSGTTV